MDSRIYKLGSIKDNVEQIRQHKSSKQDIKQIEEAILLQDHIKFLQDKYRKLYTEEYRLAGRDIKENHTKRSIEHKVNKQIVDETGYLPANILDKDPQHLAAIIKPAWNGEQPSIIRRPNESSDISILANLDDDELGAIGRLAKNDTIRWISTMAKIQKCREMKRRGYSTLEENLG